MATVHDRDPLAENREKAMHEMAALYSALDTLHDPNFVGKHLGPDAFRIDPLVAKTTPPARRARDIHQELEEERLAEQNAAEQNVTMITPFQSENDTVYDTAFEWAQEQEIRDRQVVAQHYWAKTLQSALEPPALPEGPETALTQDQGRQLLKKHCDALLGTARAAYALAHGLPEWVNTDEGFPVTPAPPPIH